MTNYAELIADARKLREDWLATEAAKNRMAWTQPDLIVVANYGELALSHLPVLCDALAALAKERTGLVLRSALAETRAEQAERERDEALRLLAETDDWIAEFAEPDDEEDPPEFLLVWKAALERHRSRQPKGS